MENSRREQKARHNQNNQKVLFDNYRNWLAQSKRECPKKKESLEILVWLETLNIYKFKDKSFIIAVNYQLKKNIISMKTYSRLDYLRWFINRWVIAIQLWPFNWFISSWLVILRNHIVWTWLALKYKNVRTSVF